MPNVQNAFSVRPKRLMLLLLSPLMPIPCESHIVLVSSESLLALQVQSNQPTASVVRSSIFQSIEPSQGRRRQPNKDRHEGKPSPSCTQITPKTQVIKKSHPLPAIIPSQSHVSSSLPSSIIPQICSTISLA